MTAEPDVDVALVGAEHMPEGMEVGQWWRCTDDYGTSRIVIEGVVTWIEDSDEHYAEFGDPGNRRLFTASPHRSWKRLAGPRSRKAQLDSRRAVSTVADFRRSPYYTQSSS